MDRQAVFNKVAGSLIAQGCRSYDGKRCMYRGPNGTKCAIGMLIPDDKIHLVVEGPGIGSLLSGTSAELRSLLGVEDQRDATFLCGLQDMHDAGHFNQGQWIDMFRYRAGIFAKYWQLDAGVILNG